jgi:hypothetical protein
MAMIGPITNHNKLLGTGLSQMHCSDGSASIAPSVSARTFFLAHDIILLDRPEQPQYSHALVTQRWLRRFQGRATSHCTLSPLAIARAFYRPPTNHGSRKPHQHHFGSDIMRRLLPYLTVETNRDDGVTDPTASELPPRDSARSARG